MKKYLITTKEKFTRDTQLAPQSYMDTDGEDDSSRWLDIDGEMFIDIIEADDEDDAVSQASKRHGLSKNLLDVKLV